RESFFTEGKKGGKWMLDLPAANRSQLLAVGVPPENIFSADICTSCNRDTFFSHRGEHGGTGRQINFIMSR
ncbi:MAG: laccase domain-containing protein, partial [Deltaproteobacteria bacterium]|nr:laccase domain-containing protein [Deltaproteobacteria bacterium]